MLQFSPQEWAALCAADERTYVMTIRDDIVKDRPELANDPDLLDRLNAAYDEAKRLGIKDDRHVVKFLYLDSVDPAFYKRPAVARWLSRKGLPPEQRFDMMLDVARDKINNSTGK